MKRKIPKFLYKYRICNNLSIDNLKNKVVWCSTLNNINDPYEGYTTVDFLKYYKEFLKIKTQYRFNGQIDRLNTIQEVIEFVIDKLNESNTTITEKIKEAEDTFVEQHKSTRNKIISETYICSFAEEFDNMLMWSHYADSHKGFCIEYNTESIERFLYKVNYKKDICNITIDLINILHGEISNIKISKPHKMTTQKDRIWSYEKEWRLINPLIENMLLNTGYKHNNGYIFPIKPRGIYLGSNISSKHKEQLLNIANDNNIHVEQMVINDNVYRLETQNIK